MYFHDQVGLDIPLIGYKHAYITTDRIPGIENMPNIRDHDASVYLKLQGDALHIGGYEHNPVLIEGVIWSFKQNILSQIINFRCLICYLFFCNDPLVFRELRKTLHLASMSQIGMYLVFTLREPSTEFPAWKRLASNQLSVDLNLSPLIINLFQEKIHAYVDSIMAVVLTQEE